MRYFVGFIITIVLIVLLIVLLFGGGGKPEVQKTSKPLTSYINTDAVVRLSIDGPVNAEQNHRQEQYTIGRDNVRYEQLEGYAQTLRRQENFVNTQENFDAFLNSLSRAGFTRGNTAKELQNEKGFCARGQRYVFELIQNNTTIQRYWNTSCNQTHTYEGDTDLTLDLFRAQIPNLNELQSDFSLNRY